MDPQRSGKGFQEPKDGMAWHNFGLNRLLEEEIIMRKRDVGLTWVLLACAVALVFLVTACSQEASEKPSGEKEVKESAEKALEEGKKAVVEGVEKVKEGGKKILEAGKKETEQAIEAGKKALTKGVEDVKEGAGKLIKPVKEALEKGEKALTEPGKKPETPAKEETAPAAK